MTSTNTRRWQTDILGNVRTAPSSTTRFQMEPKKEPVLLVASPFTRLFQKSKEAVAIAVPGSVGLNGCKKLSKGKSFLLTGKETVLDTVRYMIGLNEGLESQESANFARLKQPNNMTGLTKQGDIYESLVIGKDYAGHATSSWIKTG